MPNPPKTTVISRMRRKRSSIRRNERHINEYKEKLTVLWDRYHKFINFIFILSGGTVVIVLEKFLKFKIENQRDIAFDDYLAMALGLAAIAAVCTAVWKAIAHHFMECEILGSSDRLRTYFKVIGAESFVTRGSLRENPVLLAFYRIFHVAVPLILAVSWLFLALYLINLDHRISKNTIRDVESKRSVRVFI